MKSITQEEGMGCAIACVAFILNADYKSTKKLFDNKENSFLKGYLCRDIIKALSKKGLSYTFSKLNENNKELLNKEKIIIFVEKSNKYPAGHFLTKSSLGWMNSWINFPYINPAKSGFEKKLTAKPLWVIYPK